MKKAFVMMALATACVYGGNKTVKIELELECPESEELSCLLECFDKEKRQASYEEWKASMEAGIAALSNLIESRKIYRAQVDASAQ